MTKELQAEEEKIEVDELLNKAAIEIEHAMQKALYTSSSMKPQR